MKSICFITGTRADYGILAPIMKEVAESRKVALQIIATNMHLSADYGMTVKEIEGDGFKVDKKISSLFSGGTAKATVLSMAKVEEGLAEALQELKPDLVVILGDRYEALSSASAAVVYTIPVAHLHGGEITEGAIDDKFRNAITQLSTYHFASTMENASRIISMGADPSNVFHSGAPGAEVSEKDIDEETARKFYEKTGIIPGEPFILFAMHPVTTLPDKGEREVKVALEALDHFITQGYKILVTMPNSDPGTKIITDLLNQWGESKPEKIIRVKSLGSTLFHFAMEMASVIAGNSSAALIEAPSYRLPAVNIGIRQKGRTHGITVFDVPAIKQRIVTALDAALSLEMKAVVMGQPISVLNPYYKKESSKFIAEKLIEIVN